MKVGRNEPCPCGSGKKYKQCCGAITRAAATGGDIDGLLRQAYTLLQQGRGEDAAVLCQRILGLQPAHPAANYLSGYQAFRSGRLDQAVAQMGKAVELGIRDAAAFYHYGVALAQVGRLEEAAAQFAAALREKGDFIEARLNLANAYFEMRAFPEAGELYKEVIARQPTTWKAYHNLAHVFFYLGQHEQAIRFFQQTTELTPEYAEAHASLATMLEGANQADAAESAAQRALSLQPGNASALVVIAKCLRRKGLNKEALQALDQIDFSTATQRTYITIWNERGQNLDRIGLYGEAFQAFAESKNTQAQFMRVHYEREPMERRLEAVKTYFTRDKLLELDRLIQDFAPVSPIPLFVVGFPRSGTTLVEQILSSHPAIGAAGELEFIPQMVAALDSRAECGYPAVLDKLLADNGRQTLTELRREYCDRLLALEEDYSRRRWVVDKLPFNMLHLPLLRLLFPESPIIHVVRHPLDTVLSCYFQNFLWANEWSYKLADAASWYAYTGPYVEHMRDVLDSRYMRVKYEDIVAAPEATIRSMLAFTGADWHPACMDFHANRRVARTASYEQVTRPLYSSSIERYLNYLEYIPKDVMTALEPAIESLGYQVMGGYRRNPALGPRI